MYTSEQCLLHAEDESTVRTHVQLLILHYIVDADQVTNVCNVASQINSLH